MSDPIVQFVEVCHCGCARASHFENAYTCLMRCDCTRYRDRNKPDPPRPRVLTYPTINPVDFDDAPATHPSWCTCIICNPI